MLNEVVEASEVEATPYEKLAYGIYQNLRTALAAKSIRYERSPAVVRTAVVFQMLGLNGHSLKDSAEVLLKPRANNFEIGDIREKENISKNLVGPLLEMLRGDQTIQKYAQKINVKNAVTYHYWEKGSRDIPFATFLHLIDVVAQRLQLFCETIYFKEDLRKYGLASFKPNLSQRFFGQPWIPTVYLCLQTEAYRQLPSHSDLFLASRLNISVESAAEAIRTLLDLEVIKLKEGRYETYQSVFCTPPTLEPHLLDDLHRYWFTQSYKFSHFSGLHKVEQGSISYESFHRIKGWVAELRDKITYEMENSKPETIIHMHWQVLDLFSNVDVEKADR